MLGPRTGDLMLWSLCCPVTINIENIITHLLLVYNYRQDACPTGPDACPASVPMLLHQSPRDEDIR
ncbi:MAG: hypothetical protein AB4352_13480 [Hormoscilla sp.]